MKREIKIDVEELKQVFILVEKMNQFFHQPMNYPKIEEFAKEIYPEIRTAYYDILCKRLPDDIKNELEER